MDHNIQGIQPTSGNTPNLPNTESAIDWEISPGIGSEPPKEGTYDLITSDIRSTLKVLELLQANNVTSEKATLPDIIAAIETTLPRIPDSKIIPHSFRSCSRKCCICCFVTANPHPLYSSLCQRCGDFNLSEVGLSLPGKLKLQGKTALVTGSRVNPGFYTALRLLRCGASVLVSSYYLRDAELRFPNRTDSVQWMDCLRLMGADLRRSKNMFHLVGTIRRILVEWPGHNDCVNGR